MQILIEPLSHPYIREIHFSEKDVSGFKHYKNCPCCGKHPDNDTLASLGQSSWDRRIDLVQCRACDHIYYSNPPGVDWFENFYRSQWNAERGEKVTAELKASTGVKDTAARLAHDIGLTPDGRDVLEIGCGSGDMMAALRAKGFASLYGTEASDYRAARTALRFPGTVFKGGYEAVPDDLRFDFIYSHHVVEHIYDPWLAFGWMADHLKPGGVIAITVPNAKSEPVLNQLLFIPHLHSFSHRALHHMGANKGFDVAFWKHANTPYEVTAVFTRHTDRRHLGDAFAADRDVERLTAHESVVSRFAALGADVQTPDTIHFALHTGEKGAAAFAQTQGVRRVSPTTARISRVITPLGEWVAQRGARKIGYKWLGRNRTLTAHRSPDGSNLPIVGSVAGDLVLHIK